MHACEITVGPEGSGAAIVGTTNEAIQLALDAAAYRGGGRVQVLAGTYELADSIHLRSGVDLIGQAGQTLLRRGPTIRCPLAVDADKYDLQATVTDGSLFAPGMGVALQSKTCGVNWDVTCTRVVAVEGDTLHLADRLEGYYCPGEDAGCVINVFSPVAGREVHDVAIEGLTVDGGGTEAPFLNGCRGGGLYLYRARNCRVADCEVRNFHGDGISFQSTEDIAVTGCHVHHVTGQGIHPGTVSAKASVKGCRAHHCGEAGLYLCWSVHHGAFKGNVLEANGVGISIGHKDTDNVFTENVARHNAAEGVLFRPNSAASAGSRNRFEANVIEDNGRSRPAAGMRIVPETADIELIENVIRQTQPVEDAGQVVGVRIEAGAGGVAGRGNVIEGHPAGSVEDLSGQGLAGPLT